MGSQVSAKTNDKEQQLKKASKMALIRSLLPIVGLVVIFLLFNVLTDFRMMGNMSLVLSQVYVTMIAAMGVFFIMTMGGLDFSQGSILGISSIVVCILSQKSIPLAIIGGSASGAAIGALNGYFYVFRKIKSFIVTICTMFLFRGFIKYFTTNAPVAGSAKLINYDSTGLKTFINVIKVGSVTSSGGNQLETQILIALVLGGMPISGGAKVRFENIVVGSLLYIVLYSGLTMMGFTTQMMQLIQGVVFLIFVAVFADRESIQVIK